MVHRNVKVHYSAGFLCLCCYYCCCCWWLWLSLVALPILGDQFVSQNSRELSSDSRLCIYHLFVWSNLNFFTSKNQSFSWIYIGEEFGVWISHLQLVNFFLLNLKWNTNSKFHTYICTHWHTDTRKYIHPTPHTYVYMQTHTQLYVYTYVHAHIHTYTYTNIHTRIFTNHSPTEGYNTKSLVLRGV